MCAKRSPLRAQRCAARRQRLCVRRPTRPRTWQVLREQEGACVYAELQSKHRAAYGDDEAAREAAGKESLSTGAARLSSAVSSEGALRLRGRAGSMACASEFKPCGLLAQQCAPHRESHGREVKVSECQ